MDGIWDKCIWNSGIGNAFVCNCDELWLRYVTLRYDIVDDAGCDVEWNGRNGMLVVVCDVMVGCNKCV